jgi:hypothetical protein
VIKGRYDLQIVASLVPLASTLTPTSLGKECYRNRRFPPETIMMAWSSLNQILDKTPGGGLPPLLVLLFIIQIRR